MIQHTPRNSLFRAIADPTRRQMLMLLADADHTVSELAGPFSISQPAVSQHLKVLREAGLVQVRREGRERRYRMDPVPLKEIHDWLAYFERFWDRKLDALGNYLDSMP